MYSEHPNDNAKIKSLHAEYLKTDEGSDALFSPVQN